MGDMFRSEEMALCQMIIQQEAAYASLAELGKSGCVQFRDLSSNINLLQRKFVNEVRRCDELERRIRYIENEIRKDGIKMPGICLQNEPLPPYPREIIGLEAHLETIENELRELSQNGVNLQQNYLNMIELKNVLVQTEGFFSDNEVINLDTYRHRDPSEDPSIAAQRGQLGFVAGVIKVERFFAFERMLWRISRGNIFLKHNGMLDVSNDPETGLPVRKTVFVAFFQGDRLKQRIKKVCEGFHAAVYPCPSAYVEREGMIKDVRVRIEDLNLILSQTVDHRSRLLVSAAQNVPKWKVMIKKMKAIYHTLNHFNMDVSNKCLIGEGWIPKSDISRVQKALADCSAQVESTIPPFLNVIETTEQPPTHTRTNKFTRGFQNLIEAYGIASYREVNPGLYTCITFPFLFSLMFGDLGHAIILVIVGAVMVVFEKNLSETKGEIFKLFFGGRYIILLMGLFSIYSGLMYNDIFSKSMNIFGSQWRINYDNSTVLANPSLQLGPNNSAVGVYSLGMDPIWQLAGNKIIFQNSFKMKLSIIIAVVHMTFGVCMSLVNHIHFKKYSRIILEFIPQILFLLLFFGYMVFMMFFKWAKYSAKEEAPLSPRCAPSVLIHFINMMLLNTTGIKPPDFSDKCDNNCKKCDTFFFHGQDIMQMIFIALALICIPWMLLGRPLYIMSKRSKRSEIQNQIHNRRDVSASITASDPDLNPDSDTDSVSDEAAALNPAPTSSNEDNDHVGGHDHEDDQPMSEVFILQAIHTIEYVLSTISHTASYLRLWALSLAHAQLSEVLWMMVMQKGLSLSDNFFGAIILFIVFIPWASMTVAILVIIEGLSAFLHTLRLHWVEFMSKFYDGLGYAFQPFSFRAILDAEDEQ